MAAAGRKVDVTLIPEFHNLAGREIVKFMIPYVKAGVIAKQPDIKRILNASEGKGVPQADMWLFNTLYEPEKGFIHIHEWTPESPDVAYIECVKFVLTVITIINGNLGHAFAVQKEGQEVKSCKKFQGIEGRDPPKDYIELVYTQMYEGDKFVPVGDVVCRELSAAFGDLYDGNADEANFNEHINRALRRLLEILDEKDCRNKDILKDIVGAMLSGGDIAGRKAPIERARTTIRELNDNRFMELIERYVAEHPEITHVIMNIGASHYKIMVRLIATSPRLVLNPEMDGMVKAVFEQIGMIDMLRGGSRSGSRGSRRSRSRGSGSRRSRSHRKNTRRILK